MGNFDERVQSAISEARDLVEESILEEHGEISLDAEVPFDVIYEAAWTASDGVPSIYHAEVWEDWSEQQAWNHADDFSNQFGIPVEEWQTGDGRTGMEAFAVCVLQDIARQEIEVALQNEFEVV